MIWLLAFELVGTPFGYHKISGGFAANFVGYHIRYDLQQVGITTKRGEWLCSWIESASTSKLVVQAREFLGRLGFVAQLLVWLKPHLARLYAWGAAVAPGKAARVSGVDFELHLIPVEEGAIFSERQKTFVLGVRILLDRR